MGHREGPHHGRPARLRAVAVLGAVVGGGWLLASVGPGALLGAAPGPAVDELLAHRPDLVAAMVVRVLGLIAALRLGGAALVVAAAPPRLRRRSAHLARRLAPGALRPLVGWIVGVAAVAGATGAHARPVGPPDAPPPVVAVLVAADSADDSADDGADDSAADTSERADPAPARLVLVPSPPVHHDAPEEPGIYVVRPGDHFWSITAGWLTGRLGRPPTDAEVTPRWRELVAANADRLVRPGDPDLLLVGQTIVLPWGSAA
jgi:hypothetical protein